MIKALIIADDFTGALDSGVKFAAAGASTQITLDPDIDFSQISAEVLVLCAPTRHMTPTDAYLAIRRIAERAAALPCIVKKTDSALRGNIGAELQAILDGTGGDVLHFIPAFPAMNRITRNGIHYINETPVADSVFGQDPFEPVTESYIPALIRTQSDVFTLLSKNPQDPQRSCPYIHIHDCNSADEMDRLVQTVCRTGRQNLLAGCAGLAASLPSRLGLSLAVRPVPSSLTQHTVVVCGSLNPISAQQLAYGEQIGYRRVRLSSAQLTTSPADWSGLYPALLDTLLDVCQNNSTAIIDSFPEDGTLSSSPLSANRDTVAARIAALLKGLLDNGTHARILVIGGDTLLAFLNALNCREITPLCELQPGVVLSHIFYGERTVELISKSGGFGSPQLLEQLSNQLR